MIPRFSLSSLSTAEFRWISSQDWEEADWIQFSSIWPIPQRNLSKSPVYVRSHQKGAQVFTVGHWLLKRESQVVGSITVEGMVASFIKIYVHLSRCLTSGGWMAEQNALSFMISGIMIMTQADVLVLISADHQGAQDLTALGWGVSHEVWSPSPRVTSGLGGGAPMVAPIVTLSKQEWWQSEAGASSRKRLAYLEKRVEFEDKQTSCPPPRRIGLMARLSSWLRST